MRCGYGKCEQKAIFRIVGSGWYANVFLVYCEHHLGYALKEMMRQQQKLSFTVQLLSLESLNRSEAP